MKGKKFLSEGWRRFVNAYKPPISYPVPHSFEQGDYDGFCGRCGLSHESNMHCLMLPTTLEESARRTGEALYRSRLINLQREAREAGKVPERFERVTWGFYDTEIYNSNETTDLHFFRNVAKDRCWTNMHYPGSLPAPQSLNIEAIRVFGVTSDLALGMFRICVGNKLYGDWPLWALSIREKNFKSEPIHIQEQTNFWVDVHWETSVNLGVGLSGSRKYYQPIQVLLRGTLLRPLQ